MNVTEVCIRRPILAWVLLIAVIAAGTLALTRIGVGLLPDLDRPTLRVRVAWQGAPVESVERQVAVPLEEALAQVEGVRRIESNVNRGSVDITVTLTLDRDANAALQEAQARISAAIRRLPTDIDPPSIAKTNPEDNPILRLAVTGPLPQTELGDIARLHIMDGLQSLPGVGELSMSGGTGRTVRIWLDIDRLNRAGVTASAVQTAITRFHVENPAGEISNGRRESSVRIYGEAESVTALGTIPVATRSSPGGATSPILLRDVATFEDGFEDNASVYRVNGQYGIGIEVRKARGANAVAVSDLVNTRLAEVQKVLPSHVAVTVVRDFTGFIRESLHHLGIEIALAILLTALVCRVALGSWSAALNVMLAIPMSLLGTIFVLWLCGMTLNTFTLLGLALAVGLVVDDSIMVQEAIARRLSLGEDPPTAASRGTAEIRLAAAASTAAVIAVFAPVMAMDGELGRSFAQFGLALCVAVALSYIEAITLTPARCAWMANQVSSHGAVDSAVVERGWAWTALRRPGWILVLTLGASVAMGSALFALPRELIPPQDQGFVGIPFNSPNGAAAEVTERLAQRIEDVLAVHPAVERYFVYFQGSGGFAGAILRSDRSRKDFKQDAVVKSLLTTLASPDFRSLQVWGQSDSLGTGGGRGKDIEVTLSGANWDAVVAAANALERSARSATTLSQVGKNLQNPAPELAIVPDPVACARVGLTVQDVSTTIGNLIGGVTVGRMSVGDQRLDVRMRLRADQRITPDHIGNLLLRTPAGSDIPVRSVATIEERVVRTGFSRVDRSRAVSIYASASSSAEVRVDPPQAQAEMERLATAVSGDGIRWQPGQSAVARAEAGSGIIFAFILGILAAYLILAAQFNHWWHPVIVLAILPFTIAGAAVALLIAGASLNVITGIGLLLLMGLAKKNAILLVDCANQLYAQGTISARAAAAGAIRRRLRPILMTSVATIASALPIAIGFGPGSELRQPMALAIIGGIAISTVIAMVAIPALWMVTTSRRPLPVDIRADAVLKPTD